MVEEKEAIRIDVDLDDLLFDWLKDKRDAA